MNTQLVFPKDLKHGDIISIRGARPKTVCRVLPSTDDVYMGAKKWSIIFMDGSLETVSWIDCDPRHFSEPDKWIPPITKFPNLPLTFDCFIGTVESAKEFPQNWPDLQPAGDNQQWIMGDFKIGRL